jgi:hypothetical protein
MSAAELHAAALAHCKRHACSYVEAWNYIMRQQLALAAARGELYGV